MYQRWLIMLAVTTLVASAGEPTEGFNAANVRAIRVEYDVHFSHLRIVVNKDKISYLLTHQGPKHDAYELTSSAKALAAIAERLSQTQLFQKAQYTFEKNAENNPAYSVGADLNDGTVINRRVRHHDLYHVEGTEFTKELELEDFRVWLGSFRKPLSDKIAQDADAYWIEKRTK